jgi:hypothetical protein
LHCQRIRSYGQSTLPSAANWRSEHRRQRIVRVEGKSFELNNLDVLYIGRGNAEVSFESKDKAKPAVFYLLSYPAHAVYPVALVRKEDANPKEMGSAETCNHRTICKYIHLAGARSCQLVMGVTHLHPGSSWNTLPAHTHDRRTEVYMYFNMPDNARVIHLMGPPEETRHIVMANRDVVSSPVWSIHAGVGTQAYSFCWGMGGENQVYDDMDPAPIEKGSATLITGGTIVDAKADKDGETKGTRIESGKTQTIAPGDVIIVPAGLPHQLLIPPGTLYSAMVAKIKE